MCASSAKREECPIDPESRRYRVRRSPARPGMLSGPVLEARRGERGGLDLDGWLSGRSHECLHNATPIRRCGLKLETGACSGRYPTLASGEGSLSR